MHGGWIVLVAPERTVQYAACRGRPQSDDRGAYRWRRTEVSAHRQPVAILEALGETLKLVGDTSAELVDRLVRIADYLNDQP